MLILHFSARDTGNCADIARYIAGDGDETAALCRLQVHPCARCAYECFGDGCPYRGDDAERLYRRAAQEGAVLIVPMYCGRPSSLYFAWHERGQGFFMRHEDLWADVSRRMRIIAVYGSEQETPDYLRVFDDWFDGNAQGRVLGLERHRYHQRMADSLTDVPEVRRMLDDFMASARKEPL